MKAIRRQHQNFWPWERQWAGRGYISLNVPSWICPWISTRISTIGDMFRLLTYQFPSIGKFPFHAMLLWVKVTSRPPKMGPQLTMLTLIDPKFTSPPGVAAVILVMCSSPVMANFLILGQWVSGVFVIDARSIATSVRVGVPGRTEHGQPVSRNFGNP